MLQSVKVTVEADGRVEFDEPVQITGRRTAILTFLDEPVEAEVSEPALLSEPALATDWDREEEDEAWAHLQDAREPGEETK